MKATKMIGLAALTVLMAMAFAGGSSAMAENTTLCSGDKGSGCGLTHVHETSVGKVKVLGSFGTMECDTLFLGDVKGAALANPLVISGSYTYSNCKFVGVTCTVTEVNGPAELKVLKEGHETAKVTENVAFHAVCGESLDCTFIGVGLVSTLKGPLLSTEENGEASQSKKALTKEAGGFLCPKTAELDFTFTSLSAVYIYF